MIVDLQAESLGALRDRLADATHADNAEPLAEDAMPEHPGRRPAGPVVLWILEIGRALGETARHGEDQRHGHVGRVLGEHARRVGHGDGPVARRIEVDVVDARSEVGDEAKLRTCLRDDRAIDAVGDGRHEDVGDLGRLHELRLRHRLVVDIELGVEELAHACFDDVRQLARDDDDRLLGSLRHGTPADGVILDCVRPVVRRLR